MTSSLLSTLVTSLLLVWLSQTSSVASSLFNSTSVSRTTFSFNLSLTGTTFPRKWNIVWPRAVILGSSTVMWIDSETDGQLGPNVTVRLADSKRTYDDKILSLHPGRTISPVELDIPFTYDGQLTVRLGCKRANATAGDDGQCQSEEFPVHPLEAIQSLSLRLERTVYHPDDVGKLFGP